MKAFRQGAQSAAVAGGSKSWGTTSKRRPGAAVQDQNKSGNMGDRLIDKRLTTQIMRKRRQKNLRDLDAQVQDILDGKTGAFFPFAPKEFTGWGKWKHLIWAVVELPDDPSPMAYAVTAWILGLVSISSFTAVIETLPSLRLELANVWVGLEFFFMVNFSIEFVLRVISCPDMRQFVTVGLNWVDAVVIIPFWFEEIMALFYGSGTLPNVTFLRLLRLGKVAPALPIPALHIPATLYPSPALAIPALLCPPMPSHALPCHLACDCLQSCLIDPCPVV